MVSWLNSFSPAAALQWPCINNLTNTFKYFEKFSACGGLIVPMHTDNRTITCQSLCWPSIIMLYYVVLILVFICYNRYMYLCIMIHSGQRSDFYILYLIRHLCGCYSKYFTIEKYLQLAISDLLHLLLCLYYIIEKYWDLLSFYYHFHI